MLYLKCPTCHNLLGDKQIVYDNEISKIIQEQEIGNITKEEADKQKKDVLNKVISNNKKYCCRTRMMTYVNLTKLIK